MITPVPTLHLVHYTSTLHEPVLISFRDLSSKPQSIDGAGFTYLAFYSS